MFLSFPVTGSTDSGMLEGVLRGKSGFFPASCVQEVRLRNPDSLKQVMGAARVAGRREVRDQQQQQQQQQPDQGQLIQATAGGQQRYFATATRSKTKL